MNKDRAASVRGRLLHLAKAPGGRIANDPPAHGAVTLQSSHAPPDLSRQFLRNTVS